MQGHGLGRATEPWLDWDTGMNPKDDKRFICNRLLYNTKVTRVSGTNYPRAWLDQPLPLQVQGGFRVTRKQLRYAPEYVLCRESSCMDFPVAISENVSM